MFQIFGKFGQKQEYSSTCYVHSKEELAKLFYNKNYTIDNISVLSEKTCKVTLRTTQKKQRIKRETNCVISAFVIAYSRIQMHCDIKKLLDCNMQPFYYDTDSICWSQKTNEEVPFKCSASFGHYKSEINGQIVSFTCLGKKKYSISYLNAYGDLESVTKVCGLSLLTEEASKLVNSHMFACMLRDYINREKTENSKVPQYRKLIHDHDVLSKRTLISFGNNLKVQRIIDYKSKCLITFPHGWSKNMSLL